MGAMVIDMNETRLCALGQLKAFLEGTGEVRFQPVEDDEGRYSHIQAVLKRFAYPRLKRANKGLVLRYLGRTTGYSRQQLTRLVRQCLATGGLAKRYRPPAQGFARKYTAADVALLAETDALHDTLSGPATKHLMQRALLVFVGHPLCAAGVHLGGASLQPAGRRRLPGAPPTLGQDPSHRHPDRRAPRAATGRAPRLPAHRQRPPGR